MLPSPHTKSVEKLCLILRPPTVQHTLVVLERPFNIYAGVGIPTGPAFEHLELSDKIQGSVDGKHYLDAVGLQHTPDATKLVPKGIPGMIEGNLSQSMQKQKAI